MKPAKLKVLDLGLFALVASAMQITAANPPWVSETVEEGPHFAPDLKFTPGGAPAVAYFRFGSELVYAVRDGASWSIDAVDDTLCDGDELSLAFSPAGRPAIAYYDDEEEELRYASHDGSSWSFVRVGSASGGGALAFTPAGEPAIAYADVDDLLSYAVLRDGSWQKSPIGGFGSSIRLEMAPDGNPAVVFFESGGVEYAKFNGEGWDLENVADAAVAPFGLDFAFSPTGIPGVAFVEAPDATADLKYACRDGGAWSVTTAVTGTNEVDPNGGLSLAFAAGGNPAIIYFDSGFRIRYAAFDGFSSWSNFDVLGRVGPRGGQMSIAATAAGQPAITYRIGDFANGVPTAIGFASLGPIVAPPDPAIITEISVAGNIFTARFESEPGIAGWTFRSSQELDAFPKDETANTQVSEISPGVYRSRTTITGSPESFFLQIGRPTSP